MRTVRYETEHWDWSTVYGHHWHSYKISIMILFKWSIFSFGMEIWKWGVMVYLGPFAIGFGTVSERSKNDK